MSTPTSVVLSRDKADGKKVRDQMIKILKECWKAVNEYTAALNSGAHNLRSVVEILIASSKNVGEYSRDVHRESEKVDEDIEILEKTAQTLKALKEQISKLMRKWEKSKPGCSRAPLFATIPLIKFYDVVGFIAESYAKETSVKKSACRALPLTKDENTLNAVITLWTNHLYLPKPHLYHIKTLLLEAQLL